VTSDLARAGEALVRGRLDEAELYAWNALVSMAPEEAGELRRIADALGSADLQRVLDRRWPGVQAAVLLPDHRRRRRVTLALVTLVAVVGGVSKVAQLPAESGPLPANGEAVSAIADSPPQQIGGDGIWLVPLGRLETIDLQELASDLSSYSSQGGPVEVVPLPSWTLYPGKEQLNAVALIDLLNERYTAAPDATVVGITDYDMATESGPYTFSLRAPERYGVISTARLGADVGDRLSGHTRYERVRKLVKRQVEFHRQGGVQTDDPRSLLRPPLTDVSEIDQLDEGFVG
jgi:hypothetical protein